MTTTYTWLDGRTQAIDSMTETELDAYRVEFSDRMNQSPPQEIWPECELCGCGVSPRSRALNMVHVHQHCFVALATAAQRESVATRHGVIYDARTE